jgi:hypothetical protein
VVLDLRNQTPYTCQSLPLTARNGATLLRIVLKGGFDILSDGQLGLAQKQPDVLMEDTYWGEPGKSSIRYESDVILGKPTTDLIIVGNARAPGGSPVEEMDVQVAYENRLIKRLRVFGNREWRRGLIGARITRPEPFSAMPIVYERAFGGSDEKGSEPRNRSGIGYSSEGNHADEGMPLPNVEFPDQLIDSAGDTPEPAGLGVICKHWDPRLSYAGTYDEAWLEDRFPLLPEDFDTRFFQSVPADQWIERPRGGESVSIQGMTTDGLLRFRLPPCEIKLQLRYRDGVEDKLMEPETLLVEPDERRLLITWAASADIHGDPFRLLEMRVGEGGATVPGCGCVR